MEDKKLLEVVNICLDALTRIKNVLESSESIAYTNLTQSNNGVKVTNTNVTQSEGEEDWRSFFFKEYEQYLLFKDICKAKQIETSWDKTAKRYIAYCTEGKKIEIEQEIDSTWTIKREYYKQRYKDIKEKKQSKVAWSH